ncbi:MAG: GNAT family N-acetyltransferase, partial [Planctomycetota bacterium]
YLERCCGYQSDAPRLQHELCVVEQATGTPIGGIGFRLDPDPERRQAEVGYVLRRDRWGRGLMAEAVHGVLRFGFTQLQLHRFWAATDVQNLASARVLEKCGFQLEGCVREHIVIKGDRRSSLWYGVLASEWRAANP